MEVVTGDTGGVHMLFIVTNSSRTTGSMSPSFAVPDFCLGLDTFRFGEGGPV